MDFDIDAARKAGYSDQEIADHLAQVAGFDVNKARQAGYSDQEIVAHLSQPHIAKVAQTPNPPMEAPGMMARLGAGLNDVYQGAQYVGNKLGSLVPGAIGQAYQQNEAARVAEQQANEQAYQYGRQQAGDTGIDWGRLQGGIIGTAPLGGLAGTGVRALGGAAELAGLGSTAGEGTGLAGFLNTLGANTAAGGAVAAQGAPLAARAAALGTRVGAGAAEGTAQGTILGGGQGNAQEGGVAGGVAGSVLPILAAPVSAVAKKVAPTLSDWFQSAYNAARGQSVSAPPTSTPGVNANDLTVAMAAHGLNPNTLSPKTQAIVSQEASNQTEALGQADPDSLARKALMTELGLQPTNGMISRSPIEWAKERELAKDPKFGVPIMDAVTGNMKKINAGLNDLTAQTGGNVTTPYQAGNAVASAVQGRYDELGKGISDLYQGIRSSQGSNLASDAQGLYAKADELSDEKAGAPIVDSVMRRLKRYGMVDSEGQLTTNSMDVNQAEELRKFISAQADQNDPAQRRVANMLIDAHDNDVMSGAGGQTFEAGRNAFQQRMQEFNNAPQKAILMGKTSPEDVLKNYFINGKVDDLRALNMTLQQSPEGQQAWNDARAHVADYIQNQATGGKGADGLTFDRFNRAINTIGPEKMQMLFPDTAQNYQQWLQGTKLTSLAPGEAPVNRSNSASAMLNGLKVLGMASPHGFATKMALDKGEEILTGGAKKRAVNAVLEGTAVTPSDISASQALRASGRPTSAGSPIPGTLAGLLGLSSARPSENASP